ncbi:MAG: 6,7-dimethyl-8-ribityllumazine synthase [Burkholderiales bacterium]|nr:6,7-dimethyl-8-ribityllumazine synthase [Burkholderiales bacterium]
MPLNFIEPNNDGTDLKIGIVTSRFNEWACQGLMDSCLPRLNALGVKDENITVVTVPGALEIPFALKQLAKRGKFDAFIAIGCVIRGDTYHFNLVADQSATGITLLIHELGIPVANCILTVENDEQARARVKEKGSDGANVAVEMGNLYRSTKAKLSPFPS